jgi:hypothetical protein
MNKKLFRCGSGLALVVALCSFEGKARAATPADYYCTQMPQPYSQPNVYAFGGGEKSCPDASGATTKLPLGVTCMENVICYYLNDDLKRIVMADAHQSWSPGDPISEDIKKTYFAKARLDYAESAVLLCSADPTPPGSPNPFVCKSPQKCSEERFYQEKLVGGGAAFAPDVGAEFDGHYRANNGQGENPFVNVPVPAGRANALPLQSSP